MRLAELGETRLDLRWQDDGVFRLAGFTFDNHPYIIQLHRGPIGVEGLRGHRTAEVSFFRHDIKGDRAFATTADLETIPVKLYSVILNGVQDQFDQFDALAFEVERRHSRDEAEFEAKVRIDRYLAHKLHTRTGAWCYEHLDPGRRRFKAVVSKLELHDPTLKDPLAEAVAKLPLPFPEAST